VISQTQRALPDNTHHSQETDFYAPSGTRTHSPKRRVAADPRLRRRGQWDRQNNTVSVMKTCLGACSGLEACTKYRRNNFGIAEFQFEGGIKMNVSGLDWPG
jgi:hypothetical protein